MSTGKSREKIHLLRGRFFRILPQLILIGLLCQLHLGVRTLSEVGIKDYHSMTAYSINSKTYLILL